MPAPQPTPEEVIPMATEAQNALDDFDLSFKVFYDLMTRKVHHILLVSSPYEAFIMEEDGRLAERIIHEYEGLNLSSPPRLTWVATAAEALAALEKDSFDLVILNPCLGDRDPFDLGLRVKQDRPDLPVILLTHGTELLNDPRYADRRAIDKKFVWLGNSDLFLAIIKSVEDLLNVARDTARARVRVILLVEDSPFYYSSFLPLLYREIVGQTQAVMEESINAGHRLRRMRARPKILLAETYEEALDIFRRYHPYIHCVFSDVRFKRKGRMDPQAGFALLSKIQQESAEIPFLVLSNEESNRERALALPAAFVSKNSPSLNAEIRSFFARYLGFGDFIFRMPDGREVARAGNVQTLEKVLPSVPDASVLYHATHNHFSNWLMARCEIFLASRLRPIKASDFPSAAAIKAYLISSLRERRQKRQRGVISDFVPAKFDTESGFFKIGRGSMGGKARGLAFLATQLIENGWLQAKYPGVRITVPQSLVITTEGFEDFLDDNALRNFNPEGLDDDRIRGTFLAARFPVWLREDLKAFLQQVTYPLAVRSSSLLEDAQGQSFAGVYSTYMLPNCHSEHNLRLGHLINAVKLVWASTFLENPRALARSTLHRTAEEKMAVLVQALTGARHGDYFYPALAGVVQSYNFYPVGPMRPEEGIAHIALGLGKTVVEGGSVLHFSPRYPELLPQFSTVGDILRNAQREFFALKMAALPGQTGLEGQSALARLTVDQAADHPAVRFLASGYNPQDQRIRDRLGRGDTPVVTFASVLKHGGIPLPAILVDLLDLGHRGMGGPMEIEFALTLASAAQPQPNLSLLQIRPMAKAPTRPGEDALDDAEMHRALCYSSMLMGTGGLNTIRDLVYVKPEAFDPARTVAIAGEIAAFNGRLKAAGRKYLLIGPGRWGSADRWLGIPVRWQDISGVGAIVETTHPRLHAEPSQGTHFFHNITSLGISYITISRASRDFIDWPWLAGLPPARDGQFVRHVALAKPMRLKFDGKRSCAAILIPQTEAAHERDRGPDHQPGSG
jgi:DNA-binding response OmpR family regulator